jgi:16S rRNA (cytosine967-C5)-methyltransferase
MSARAALLVYATCSLLSARERRADAAFLPREPGWTLAGESAGLSPLDGGDGFFVARFIRRGSRTGP